MAERDPDARYEFDAPSHVVDFSLETDGREDLWFDQQAARGADGPLQTPMRSEPSSPPSSLLLALPQEEVSGPSASTSPPPNLVTSWGGGSPARTGARPKRSAAQRPPAQPRRVSKRKEETASAPPAKKHKKTPPVPRRSSRVRRGNTPHNARTAPTSKAAASSTAHPDSEQLELEHIGTLQAEVALRRRQNEASYRAALAGQPPPKKAVLPLTLPKEFSLTSNSRVKAPAEPDGVGFVQQLRRPSTPVKALRFPTVPKPFNLSTGHKRAPEAAAYVSTAQQVESFHKRTPDRFHLPSRQAAERGPAALKAEKLKLTEPQSPKLTAGQRSRETERASLQEEEEEAPPAFRATRLPRKMLEGVVGVPERKLLLPTVPESPAFSLKRLRPHRELEVKPLPPVLRAAPPPHAGVPFQPRLPESRQVEVCPFSFEERDRERRSLKERTLQELRHGEVAPFKAQPLPSFDSVLLPEKKTLAPTRPEPFRLQVDQRGALRSALREQQVKDEQRREEGAAFRARPNTVTHKEPFQPRKEARPPVVVEAFQLSTERRAAERQEFEQQAGAREALGRLQEERQRQEQEQEEKEEVARLRREQVHAAQPIRHYRAVAVKKSELPLTVPHSPNFSDRFRL